MHHRRPAQLGSGEATRELLDGPADARRVLEHVVGMVGAVLLEAYASSKLGDGLTHDLGLGHERPCEPPAHDDARELLTNALARDAAKP